VKTVLIIGSGFIGAPLALQLMELGYNVSITTTQTTKQTHLNNLGLNALVFNSDDVPSYQQFKGLSFDYVLYTLPPSACKITNYTVVLSTLLCNLGRVGTVVFTSSISVYLNNNTIHTEQSCALQSNSNVIITTEEYIKNNCAQYYIFRLAGLIGSTRHPSNFFKQGVLDNSKALVNLVTGNDVVLLISQAIFATINYGTYNICAPEHPTKQAFYTHYSPTLLCNTGIQSKEINGNAIAQALNCKYSTIYI
jgi:nucleoside-diphosphate-sugar epimerase